MRGTSSDMNYFYCKKIYKPTGGIEYFPIGKIKIKDDKFIITGYSLLLACERFFSHNTFVEYTIPKNKKEIIDLFKYVTFSEYTELVDENKLTSKSDGKEDFGSETGIFNLKTFDFKITDAK